MWIIKNIKAFKNWHLCYLIKYGMVNSESEIKTRSGLKFLLRPNTRDYRIVRSIFALNNYIRDFIPIEKGSIVFDVGANIGAFSLFASQFASKVFSFEPEPKNYEMLLKNISINGITNIIPYRRAISNSDGTMDFYLYPDTYHTGCHSLFKLNNANTEKIQVEISTLENVMEKEKLSKIDFLKLDCEGAEYDILKSINKKTADKIKYIAMETHEGRYSEENYYDIPTYLNEIGYEVMTEANGKYIYARKRNI